MSYNAASSSSSQPQELPGLSKGQEIDIYDGRFVQHNESDKKPQAPIHVCSDAKDGFQHLQAHVATAAFDPKEKMDAPKCHPNTRVAVLDVIINWILQAVMTAEWIMWLNGAAGAGKSAIGRSIVDRCLQMKIPIARFFFFRIDSTRNTIDSIVGTLAHQLIKCLPDLRMPIVSRIQADPLIFSQSLETQFNYLIFEPLIQLEEQFTTPQTVVLLFDGLDELSGDNNQVDLINIMATFVALKAYPLIVFFGSRNEYQIKQAFEMGKCPSLVRTLPLDNNYMADDDIHLFLTDSFSEITKSHPHRELLPDTWPTSELVDEMVTKSSGQFIYASVVVKFISMPRMHPAQQLDIIRGLRPAGALTPFAQLDALYLHIFRQVEDLANTMRILAAVIFCKESAASDLSNMFPDHISSTSIPLLLSSLSAVISIRGQKIIFLHTSLPDFLLDRTRSQHFYIDRVSWSTQLSIELSETYVSRFYRIAVYTGLLRYAQPTEELRQRLTDLYPYMHVYEDNLNNYLLAIKNLDFGDGGKVYRLQLKYAVQHHNYSPAGLDRLAQHHDVARIMQEIRKKEARDKRVRAVAQKMRSWGAQTIGRSVAWLRKHL